MSLLNEIHPDTWIEDVQYSLLLSLEHEELREQHLLHYLEERYSQSSIAWVCQSVVYSCNFVIRNWDYLTDIGLLNPDSEKGTTIVNALLFSLYDWVSNNPDTNMLKTLPSVDPSILVKKAQEFINAEKK